MLAGVDPIVVVLLVALIYYRGPVTETGSEDLMT